MRPLSLITLLAAAFTSHVAAQGLKVVAPAAGAAVPAAPIQVTLADGGGTPALANIASYAVTLIVGGNTATDSKELTAGNAVAPTLTLAVPVTPDLIGPIQNGFYLRVLSTLKEGGTIVNFSPRFSISGLTGPVNEQLANAAKAVGAAVPATQNNAAAAAPAPGAAGGAGGAAQDGVPYNLQTGLTKYAPMQPIPPTKITKGNPTPLFPTSAYTIATTWMPRPSIVTTLTASQTFSVSSVENTAAAQSMPTGHMAKFLARWKD